eukprot:TRINITY_DN887_c0_g1_i2.p2 TRINITY_DN887_c0_g1~~TRINITY_DN887_c0_g1_i2.p2  ORF type:complete len:429 (+),score=140.88 TRINITY_DN887_c0_g1_i2:40-1326(+)
MSTPEHTPAVEHAEEAPASESGAGTPEAAAATAREDSSDLITAVQLGDISAANEVLRKRRGCVNTPDAFGDTALHYASARGSMQLANALLRAGADANVKNGTGSTPLHKAAANGEMGVIKQLMKHGADPLIENGSGLLAEHITRNPRARTFLMGDAATRVTVDVPKAQHRVLIGPKGATLRELEADTRCTFEIPKPKDPSPTISITGRGDAPLRAKAILEETYCSARKKGVLQWGGDELEAMAVSMRMSLAKEKQAKLAGKAKREIEQELGVRIVLPQDDDDQIRIEGRTPDDVDAALKRVLAAANAREQQGRRVPLRSPFLLYFCGHRSPFLLYFCDHRSPFCSRALVYSSSGTTCTRFSLFFFLPLCCMLLSPTGPSSCPTDGFLLACVFFSFFRLWQGYFTVEDESTHIEDESTHILLVWAIGLC